MRLHKPKKIKFSENEIRSEILKVYSPKQLWQDMSIFSKTDECKYDLSLIVPVYNSEKYLERCIKSMVNQKTKFKYEIIFINDGSTDGSEEILKTYRQMDNIKILNQKNTGISGARNKGLSIAEGKYIGFIDNDDYVSEEYVEKLLNRAYLKDADMVKCGHFRVNKKGIFAVKTYEEASVCGFLGEKINLYSGLIWEGISKREMWDKVRFPVGFWYEDVITKIILMRICTKFECVGEALYYYYLHENNASKKVWNSENIKSLDQYFIIEELLKYSLKLGLPLDGSIYKLLLIELGEFLYTRTQGLSADLKKAIFLLASTRVAEIKKEVGDIKLTYVDQKLEQAFCNGDFHLWKLASHFNSVK
jgi:glycosyltransferase involved in cell wall biosynthesis